MRSGLHGPFHESFCNVLVEPPKLDRFFMDMRVYKIMEDPSCTPAFDDHNLVWRGIYLAVEIGPGTGRNKTVS